MTTHGRGENEPNGSQIEVVRLPDGNYVPKGWATTFTIAATVVAVGVTDALLNPFIGGQLLSGSDPEIGKTIAGTLEAMMSFDPRTYVELGAITVGGIVTMASLAILAGYVDLSEKIKANAYRPLRVEAAITEAGDQNSIARKDAESGYYPFMKSVINAEKKHRLKS